MVKWKKSGALDTPFHVHRENPIQIAVAKLRMDLQPIISIRLTTFPRDLQRPKSGFDRVHPFLQVGVSYKVGTLRYLK